MKKIRLCFLTFSIITLASSAILAHDLWLVPQTFRINPGDSVTISANTGMDFPNSLSAITADRINQFILRGKSEEKDITEFEVQGNSLVTKCKFKESGTYVVGVALRPREIKLTAEEFNEYLLHDGLPNIYELRKKEGILDKDAVEHYSKYPKAIIQVGKKLNEVPTKPLGLPIEIVPKANPYKLQLGDDLRIKVLFQRKPLSGIEIAWSYPGKGEEFAGSKKTDKNGEAVIPLSKVGPYVIRLTHMEWVKKPTHEWESYWTSLTFDVLEKGNSYIY